MKSIFQNRTVMSFATLVSFLFIAPVYSEQKYDLSLPEPPQVPPGRELQTLPGTPRGGEQSLGEKCTQMSKEIESLKGKPQRRSALRERFERECRK
jgi:hypothetical protein